MNLIEKKRKTVTDPSPAKKKQNGVLHNLDLSVSLRFCLPFPRTTRRNGFLSIVTKTTTHTQNKRERVCTEFWPGRIPIQDARHDLPTDFFDLLTRPQSSPGTVRRIQPMRL